MVRLVVRSARALRRRGRDRPQPDRLRGGLGRVRTGRGGRVRAATRRLRAEPAALGRRPSWPASASRPTGGAGAEALSAAGLLHRGPRGGVRPLPPDARPAATGRTSRSSGSSRPRPPVFRQRSARGDEHLIGQTLAHYRVTAAIGAGGMGEVYRAADTKLGRDVALKVLPAEVTGDAERLSASEREAQLLASLNHPSIAAIYGIEEAAAAHLVLELVEGEDLAVRLKREHPSSRGAGNRQAGRGGLEAAHEKGIVHRDLTPAGIDESAAAIRRRRLAPAGRSGAPLDEPSRAPRGRTGRGAFGADSRSIAPASPRGPIRRSDRGAPPRRGRVRPAGPPGWRERASGRSRDGRGRGWPWAPGRRDWCARSADDDRRTARRAPTLLLLPRGPSSQRSTSGGDRAAGDPAVYGRRYAYGATTPRASMPACG